jgi:hypothetical protein
VPDPSLHPLRGWRIHAAFWHVCDFFLLHVRVPGQRHYYGLNHLHFLTASTYRRARLFDAERFRRHLVKTLEELRRSLRNRRLRAHAGALSPADRAIGPG